jgi:hypothetical protein
LNTASRKLGSVILESTRLKWLDNGYRRIEATFSQKIFSSSENISMIYAHGFETQPVTKTLD